METVKWLLPSRSDEGLWHAVFKLPLVCRDECAVMWLREVGLCLESNDFDVHLNCEGKKEKSRTVRSAAGLKGFTIFDDWDWLYASGRGENGRQWDLTVSLSKKNIGVEFSSTVAVEVGAFFERLLSGFGQAELMNGWWSEVDGTTAGYSRVERYLMFGLRVDVFGVPRDFGVVTVLNPAQVQWLVDRGVVLGELSGVLLSGVGQGMRVEFECEADRWAAQQVLFTVRLGGDKPREALRMVDGEPVLWVIGDDDPQDSGEVRGSVVMDVEKPSQACAVWTYQGGGWCEGEPVAGAGRSLMVTTYLPDIVSMVFADPDLGEGAVTLGATPRMFYDDAHIPEMRAGEIALGFAAWAKRLDLVDALTQYFPDDGSDERYDAQTAAIAVLEMIELPLPPSLQAPQ